MSDRPEVALRDRLPFAIIRRSKLERLERSVAKYRKLRGHVRKDGVVKLAMPRKAAEKHAAELTEKHGKLYSAYGCSYCKGLFHVGHTRRPNDQLRHHLDVIMTDMLEPSLSEPECMHCGDPGVPLIDQGGWYLCKPCARRSERAAAKLADQVRESEFARPVTDRSHKDSETITQPEKIPLGTTASCGIADCSGSHTPQDHNTVMDLVAAHTDTELAELVVGVRGDFEVVMADYQDAARRLVEMQAERDELRDLLLDVRNAGFVVFHTGDTEGQREVKRQVQEATNGFR